MTININSKIDVKQIKYDGKNYIVTPKTKQIEEKMIDWSTRLNTMTLFDACTEVIEILLGAEAKAEIVGDENTVDVDLLQRIAEATVTLYKKESDDIRAKQQANMTESLKPIVDTAKAVNEIQKVSKNAKH